MAWGVVFYMDERGNVPGDDFLDSCPPKVAATILAVLETVRESPPPAFSGGGKWEAMHGEMGGYYEVRVTGPGRRHYRLFCLLENGTPAELRQHGLDGPVIAVINGMEKAHMTEFTDAEYRKHVRRLGDDFLRTSPRRFAT